VGGGGSLGAVPNYAVLSPLSLRRTHCQRRNPRTSSSSRSRWACGCFLFLLAPAFASHGSSYSLARQQRIHDHVDDVAPARVAAAIPAVFWGAERLATERRARDSAGRRRGGSVLVGSPAVTGCTLARPAAISW
jgi:hypothetical protein